MQTVAEPQSLVTLSNCIACIALVANYPGIATGLALVDEATYGGVELAEVSLFGEASRARRQVELALALLVQDHSCHANLASGWVLS